MTDLTVDQLERRGLIAQLFGAFGRTPKEHEFTGYESALKLMDTATLARVVSTWLEKIPEATDPEDLRVPTAGKLWMLRRQLRRLPSPRPLTLEQQRPPTELDGWTLNANQLLLAWITDPRERRAARYAPDSHMTSPAKGRQELPVGQDTIDRTRVLVKWKDAWAADMRDDRAEGGSLDGKSHWLYCMGQADKEIDRMISHQAAA